NLQHATVVVNIDLPWNPAVLEQRIGRVHRLGQTRPVQVVNFVAKGTIEEGMLSVLGFKRSLFAGVLDGGDREVFLGGSRLKRFMESVENVTAGIPTPIVEEAAEPAATEPPVVEDSVDDDREVAVASASLRPAADPLSNLLRTGLELLSQFGSAARRAAGFATTGPSRRSCAPGPSATAYSAATRRSRPGSGRTATPPRSCRAPRPSRGRSPRPSRRAGSTSTPRDQSTTTRPRAWRAPCRPPARRSSPGRGHRRRSARSRRRRPRRA